MRSFLIKASIWVAIFVAMVFISIADNENVPVWAVLLGLFAPAAYIFLISELEVF